MTKELVHSIYLVKYSTYCLVYTSCYNTEEKDQPEVLTDAYLI